MIKEIRATIKGGSTMEHEINKAYDKLSKATNAAFEVGQIAIAARVALDTAKLQGLADGTISGKNADMREASAREVLAEIYASAEAADEAAKETRHTLDLARIEVERVRALLRLAELWATSYKPAPTWTDKEIDEAL